MTSQISPSSRRGGRSLLLPLLYAVAIGLIATLVLLLGGIVYALTTAHALDLPGVLSYRVGPGGMALTTSGALPVTWAVLSVALGLPLGVLIGRAGHGHD